MNELDSQNSAVISVLSTATSAARPSWPLLAAGGVSEAYPPIAASCRHVPCCSKLPTGETYLLVHMELMDCRDLVHMAPRAIKEAGTWAQPRPFLPFHSAFALTTMTVTLRQLSKDASGTPTLYHPDD